MGVYEYLSVGNVLLALVVVLITNALVNWLRVLAWDRKYQLKGPPVLPFIGTFYAAFGQTMDELEVKHKKEYGGVTRTSFGILRQLHVCDLELLKKIFVKEFVHFQNRFSMDDMDPWPMDRGLLSLKDDEWKRVRTIITPSFSAGKLKHMVREMNYCASALTDILEEQAKTGNQVVAVRKHFGCFSMDVIASTAFGLRTESYRNPQEPFVVYAKKVFDQDVLKNPLILIAIIFPSVGRLLNRCGIKLFYPPDSLKFFVDVIQKLIEERKERGDTGRTDFLQLMMNAELQEDDDKSGKQSKKFLDSGELYGQGIVFFVAGYETTSALLQFASYVLATKPEIQEKLLVEIDALGEVEASYENVTELKYLDMFISECLRMYPPICRMNRMTSKTEDVQIDGQWFPRNTAVQYSIYQIHHDPDNYTDPEEFIPERFSPEQKAKLNTLAFIPFGYGPRNCIGMRLALLTAKIGLVHVLRRVKFSQCSETEVPLQFNQETFLRVKNPIKVAVELRQ